MPFPAFELEAEKLPKISESWIQTTLCPGIKPVQSAETYSIFRKYLQGNDLYFTVYYLQYMILSEYDSTRRPIENISSELDADTQISFNKYIQAVKKDYKIEHAGRFISTMNFQGWSCCESVRTGSEGCIVVRADGIE